MVVSGDNLDLQVRRKRLGLSQEQVAIDLGVAQSSLSRFETNDMPLPAGQNRKTYERYLDDAEKRAKRAGAA